MKDSTRRSLLREPLLHFLAIGAALFLYFHWVGPGSGPNSTRIVLTAGQIEHLAAGFVRTWQREPTRSELKGLVDDWVREKIAVREAMAAGLDRDDSVLRRRLRQKLEFLLDDAAAPAPPSDQELQAWLEQHADSYRVEKQLQFRQVYVSRDRRGAAAHGDARALLSRLVQAGPEARIDELGDTTLLPQEVDLAPRGEGTLPDPATVRARVERDYQSDLRRRNTAAIYEKLLEKYTVVTETTAGAAPATRGNRTGGS